MHLCLSYIKTQLNVLSERQNKMVIALTKLYKEDFWRLNCVVSNEQLWFFHTDKLNLLSLVRRNKSCLLILTVKNWKSHFFKFFEKKTVDKFLKLRQNDFTTKYFHGEKERKRQQYNRSFVPISEVCRVCTDSGSNFSVDICFLVSHLCRDMWCRAYCVNGYCVSCDVLICAI